MVAPPHGGIHRTRAPWKIAAEVVDEEICLRYKRRAIISRRAAGVGNTGVAVYVVSRRSRGSGMLAVIGNIIIGFGVVSLFTATLRLTKPGKRA
jgi:UPF0288 family protein (methanogenesis marker protein 3)